MNDRDLLEAAAKAAGRKVFSYIDDPIFGSGINDGETDKGLWNPLENDGDALRLAVKLAMDVHVSEGDGIRYTFVASHYSDDCGLTECHEDDPYAATRRAIVRTAAMIGGQS
jgi:hypothetical protein